MQKIIYMFSSLKMLISFLFITFAAIHHRQSPGIPVQGYGLYWQDEFDGNSINFSKWGYRALGPRGDAYNSPTAVRLNGNGQLVIDCYCEGNNVFACMISTQDLFETTYGYFECRAALTHTPGIWPGFWLQSSKNITGGVPETNGAELDIVEYFMHVNRYTVAHSIHWGGYGSTHKMAGPLWVPIEPSSDGFHVFGLEWTPSGYKTFVDGKMTYSGDQLISKVPEYIILSLEVNRQVAGPLDLKNLPDSFIVDYVRVYKKL